MLLQNACWQCVPVQGREFGSKHSISFGLHCKDADGTECKNLIALRESLQRCELGGGRPGFAKSLGAEILEEPWASDGKALILTENVFRIRQVVSSTEKEQVRLQIDGRVYTLEPGEVLLLLG